LSQLPRACFSLQPGIWLDLLGEEQAALTNFRLWRDYPDSLFGIAAAAHQGLINP